MGGNILLHMATMQPDRLKAMIVVSATMYFPEQARAIMRQVPLPDKQPLPEWERMRRSHKHGDQQIIELWNWTRGLQDSYDDMNFTPPFLSKVTAPTLIVYGDRAWRSSWLLHDARFGWFQMEATVQSSALPLLSSQTRRSRSFELQFKGLIYAQTGN